MCRSIWTFLYVLTWFFIILGTLLYHLAIKECAPGLKDLPDNLVKGFEVVFGFENLETESDNIKSACASAIAKCSVVVANCNTAAVMDNIPITRNASTRVESTKIMTALNNTLKPINKVCNDKYFGVDSFADASASINNVIAEFNKLTEYFNNGPCRVTTPIYCEMHKQAGLIVEQKETVDKQIDKFTDNDLVKRYNKYSRFLFAMHGLPYLLWISAFCFAYVWYFDGAAWCPFCKNCPCAGGSKIGCCFIFFHILFWLVIFILASVVTGIGMALKFASDQIQLDFLKGKPNLKQVLEHIQTEYADFWDVVFGDLEPGLNQLFRAACAFEVFCVVIVVYGCCMCCCRPYRDQKAPDGTPIKEAWNGDP